MSAESFFTEMDAAIEALTAFRAHMKANEHEEQKPFPTRRVIDLAQQLFRLGNNLMVALDRTGAIDG